MKKRPSNRKNCSLKRMTYRPGVALRPVAPSMLECRRVITKRYNSCQKCDAAPNLTPSPSQPLTQVATKRTEHFALSP